MRKAIVVLSGLLLFWGGWCFGQDSPARNGTGWKNFDRVGRLLYVEGFDKGHAAGMSDGFEEVLEMLTAAKLPSSWTPEERKKLADKASQIDQKAAAYSAFTIGQIEATVSTFYEDYRNAPVCWNHAISFSTSSLKGGASTDQELDAARKADAERGCK
jgi:hypothetical protein